MINPGCSEEIARLETINPVIVLTAPLVASGIIPAAAETPIVLRRWQAPTEPLRHPKIKYRLPLSLWYEVS